MNRRKFATAAGVAALAGPLAAADAKKKQIVELRWIRMRNTTDNQVARTTDFVRDAAAALQRAGTPALGFFAPVIAEQSPFILALSAYPSLAEMETIREKQNADPDYRKSLDAYAAGPQPAFTRVDTALLRCFAGMPSVDVPPTEGRTASRIFELRTYESNTGVSLARKIKMFNDAEIGIFKRLGMLPVFFGEAFAGARMPNLTYMLAFDDLAARDKLWRAFGADPEWQKLRALPGNADGEIVSNISNSILRPLPFSQIR
ncbi:MAG: NIPSNAP family protein [Acidobacteriota bacterium]|nr:NIPSNAP family protein [Acidobacteriota bacterium]